MRITLIQTDIVWARPAANIEAAERALLCNEGSDLYVLPEMWTTGFAVSPDEIQSAIAESDATAVQWMRRMADRLDAAVAGSVATQVGSTLRNRFLFVKPGGEVTVYDKHHLFTYGGEHQAYTAGSERVELEWRGVRFLLQVCYDLRFPVFSRNNGATPYDVALYVASWPQSRRTVWDTLLKARALENQCYVCGVNRIGSDLQCEYSGGTTVVDAYGRNVASVADNESGEITVELDLNRLSAFRQKFPVLQDAD